MFHKIYSYEFIAFFFFKTPNLSPGQFELPQLYLVTRAAFSLLLLQFFNSFGIYIVSCICLFQIWIFVFAELK